MKMELFLELGQVLLCRMQPVLCSVKPQGGDIRLKIEQVTEAERPPASRDLSGRRSALLVVHLGR